MDTRKLLAQCAAMINKYGPDSNEVLGFIDQHKGNAEFGRLANLSRSLKRVLTPVPEPTGKKSGQRLANTN